MDNMCMAALFQQVRWYALFVRSNQEKRVAQHLAEKAVEHFLPCYQSVRQRKDRRVTLQIPLFAGYVFVRLAFVERMKVLTVPNVVSLVGTRTLPAAISDEEIAWIMRGVEYGKIEPHECLKVGQRVVINSGAMAGANGILLQRRNHTRVVISLDSIAQAFVVEVDASCIEPLDTNSRHATSDCPTGNPDIPTHEFARQ